LVGDKINFVCSQPDNLINENLTKICVKGFFLLKNKFKNFNFKGGYINLNAKNKRNKNENIIKCPFGLHLNNKGECTKNGDLNLNLFLKN